MIKMSKSVILYSTGCPKCKILKKKLDEKGVKYQEISSIEDMENLGIKTVPVLNTGDDILLGFADAVKWINGI